MMNKTFAMLMASLALGVGCNHRTDDEKIASISMFEKARPHGFSSTIGPFTQGEGEEFIGFSRAMGIDPLSEKRLGRGDD